MTLDEIFGKVVIDMKFVLDVILMLGLYLSSVLALNSDYSTIITVVGSSICGAVVLAYFRRDRDRREIFFKSACASISGLFCGSLFARYFGIETREYVISVYFFSSLLSLFLLKGLVTVTDQNASGFIVTILQKFLPTGTPVNGNQITPQPGQAEHLVSTEVVVTKEKSDGK